MKRKSSSLRWVWSSFKCYFHVFAIQFESIAFMIAFMVALQISAAFYFPALQSVIPLIVREHELLQMNGVHMNVGTIARIAGTSLGGILFSCDEFTVHVCLLNGSIRLYYSSRLSSYNSKTRNQQHQVNKLQKIIALWKYFVF